MRKFTKAIKPEEVKRDWILIDAKDKIFGRVITEIATYLRGKHKPYYTPHVDCGDFVVVINADKVKFSTNKKLKEKYYRHTGYFGHVKEETVEKLLRENPEKLFKLATRGMLPKTRLGRKMLKKLKVYAGENHPHTAQLKKGSK
ncbi:MAG: 50S ribosomal protein L13 [Campylobacterales bacterium]